MRVAVMGAGAVGGYFGAKLAAAGHDVAVVARGANLRAIRERGLLVWSPLGDFLARPRAEDDPEAIGPVDLVLVAVKTYDLEAAAARVPPLLGPETAVLTLQNGVDAPEVVARVVGERAVLAGAAYIATALAAPGLIVQTGTYRRIAFGEFFAPEASVSERVARIAQVLAGADIQAEPVADARVALWDKLVYLAPIAGLAAAARVDTGILQREPALRDAFVAAAGEAAAVARALGIPVAGDLVDRVTRFFERAPAAMRPSLLMDLLAGRRLEVEALQGAIVRRGAQAGVPTPVMATLYAVLKPHAEGPAGLA